MWFTFYESVLWSPECFFKMYFGASVFLFQKNRLFWNGETRCPRGYSSYQNLQKHFSSCVSEDKHFQLTLWCSNTAMLKEVNQRCINSSQKKVKDLVEKRRSFSCSPQRLTYTDTSLCADSLACHSCALIATRRPEHVRMRPTIRPTD